MKGLALLLYAVALTQADWPQLSHSGRACDCNSDEVKAACAQYGSDNELFEHENCNQFYKCSNGQAYPYFCYSGLVYDSLTQICDWPSNVDCGSRPIVDESVDCSNEVEDDDSDNSSSDGSDAGSGPDTETCDCDPSEAPKICNAAGSDGVLVAHENCNQFYKCARGVPVAFTCPLGLLYNAHIGVCDWPDNVDCGGKPTEVDGSENGSGNGNGDSSSSNENEDVGSPGTCNCKPGEAPGICAADGSDGAFVAHENCSQFYKCVNGAPITMNCPVGLLYNPYIECCDWPSNVKCDRPIVEVDGENGSHENGNGDSGNGNGDDGSNGGTCNCKPEEAPAICAAENSDGILIAHEKCNKFYKCSFGKPVAITCLGELLYNPYIERCDWPQNVDCTDKVIPDSDDNGGNGSNESNGDNGGNGNGEDESENESTCNCNPGEAPEICGAPGSDGILIAHEKCNKLYKCANGVPVALKCPGILLYNPYTQQCDWPDNVECGDRVIVDKTDNGSSENGSGDNGNGDNESSCNCKPEEAPAICANENSDGVLIAHEKCNKFYMCSFGIPVAIQCPANLLYNPLNEVCDWPENVECGYRPVDEIDNGGNEDNDNGDDNNNGGNCNPSEAPAICAASGSDGVLVAHEYCNQFYKCSDGLPVALICPSLLLYNPATAQCDWPQNVDCGDRVISGGNDNEGNGDNGNNEDNGDNGDNGGHGNGESESGGTCNCNPGEAPEICGAPGSDGILIAHEKCNKLYKCANGVPVALKCPGILVYNPYTQQCDWPDNVECGDRVIVDETDNGSSENGSGDNGNGDNESSCNCKPEEAPAICANENSDGVLIAHEKCNKFYICSFGIPVAIQCPANLLYNPFIEVCDWPENVECGYRPVDEIDNGGNEDNDSGDDNNNGGNCNPSEAPAICAASGSDGVLVAHEYCNQFYKCSDGLPVALICPSLLLYNPATAQCDWPQNVDCGDRVVSGGNDNEGNGDNGNNENNGDNGDNGDNGGHGNGESESGGTCNCNPGEAPEICGAPGSDGILIAHEKCNKLYKCANGVPVALKCPGILVYNPYTQQCDWPDNVECGDRVIVDETDNGSSENGSGDNGNGDNESSCNCKPEEAPAICANENSDGVLIAHEKCNKFYICSFGIPVAIQCPANLLYNPFIEVCDWPENVECGYRPVDEIDNGGNEDNDSGDDNNNGGNCNPSEAPAICAASGSDGVLVAHEYCNQFYKCSDGLPVALICPSLLLYNPATAQCDWPQNVDCGDRVISGGNDNEGNGDNGNNEDNGDNGDNGGHGNGESESGGTCNCNPSEAPAICAAPGSDGVLVAHEVCNQFYKCSDGLPNVFTCPTTLLYNPPTEKCDWPKNVVCGDRAENLSLNKHMEARLKSF